MLFSLEEMVGAFLIGCQPIALVPGNTFNVRSLFDDE